MGMSFLIFMMVMSVRGRVRYMRPLFLDFMMVSVLVLVIVKFASLIVI